MLFHEAALSAVIVIPARFASTRFPGKPLARQTGKYLIQHVVEQARKVSSASDVVVATDDSRIAEAVASFGGRVAMTRADHESGTDRIAEVVQQKEFLGAEIVVNVQGDEPEVEPELVGKLIRELETFESVDIATAAVPFERLADVENPNMVKVVTDAADFALYFSRSVIPFDRSGAFGRGAQAVALTPPYRKHLGIYAYRRDALLELSEQPVCELEQFEKLEQLRALYLGMQIHVTFATHGPHGIDTPDDYAAFVERYNSGKSTT
jgi:3-deoxy-manno-octulosonate cytidylyltransferase (CMP-KDO synthetase)